VTRRGDGGERDIYISASEIVECTFSDILARAIRHAKGMGYRRSGDRVIISTEHLE